MTDEDAQAAAGTAAGQGPVTIDEELARHLANEREELFETHGIPEEFPAAVREEARARTEDARNSSRPTASQRSSPRRSGRRPRPAPRTSAARSPASSTSARTSAT